MKKTLNIGGSELGWPAVLRRLILGCALAAPCLPLTGATAPDLVSPTAAPARGYARFGDVIGPITADGTTTAFRATNIKPDHKVAIQVYEDDDAADNWDGAVATIQMRICATAPETGGNECPFIAAPNVLTISDDAGGLAGNNFQVYGPETEIRLSIASAGAGTILYFTVRQ